MLALNRTAYNERSPFLTGVSENRERSKHWHRFAEETGGGQCVETCMFVCVCVCVCVHNVICLCEGISDDMGRRWWGVGMESH